MTNWAERLVERLLEAIAVVDVEEEDEEIIVLDKVSDFLEKLKEYEVSLTIVKDPYKLAFAPYYMLWFEKDGTHYRTFVSPDSAIWGRIQYHLKISFPSEDGSWAQEVPYEKIKKFL